MTPAAVGRFERFTVLMMHRAPVALRLLPGKMLFWILVAGLENAINFFSSPMATNPLAYLTGKPLPLHAGSSSPAARTGSAGESGVRAAALLSALAACALWLQRLRDSLPAVWRLTGTRVLAQDTELLRQLTQLVWDNAETPVRLGC